MSARGHYNHNRIAVIAAIIVGFMLWGLASL